MTFRYEFEGEEVVIDGREERTAQRLNNGRDLVLGSLTEEADRYCQILLQASRYAQRELAPKVASLDALVFLARQRGAGDLPVYVSRGRLQVALRPQFFRKGTVEGEPALIIDLDVAAGARA